MLFNRIKKYILICITCFIFIIGQVSFLYATPINPDGTTMSAEEAATYVEPEPEIQASISDTQEYTQAIVTEPLTTIPETTAEVTEEPTITKETTTEKESTTEKETPKETTTKKEIIPKVQAIINNIKTLPEITFLSSKDSKAISKIRMEYDALSKQEKQQVSNINKLIEYEKIIEDEKTKKYSYSFEYTNNKSVYCLYILWDNSNIEKPKLTFVAPDSKEIIMYGDISSQLTAIPDITVSSRSIEDNTVLTINAQQSGIWTLKSDTPLTISTESPIIEETITTIDNPTTEIVTKTSITDNNIINILNNLPKKKLLIVLAVIIGVIIGAIYLGKSFKNKDTKTDKPTPDFLINEDKDLDIIPEEDNVMEANQESKGFSNFLGRNKKNQNTLYENEYIDFNNTSNNDNNVDKEIERLRSEMDAMWAEIEPIESTNKNKSNNNQEEKLDEDEIQYITQEDIDNDVTIEEYFDNDSNIDKEIEEKIRKKRSFFPEDRFS